MRASCTVCLAYGLVALSSSCGEGSGSAGTSPGQPTAEWRGGPTISVGSAAEYGVAPVYGIVPVTCGWAEPTTVVVAPGAHPSCPEGRILFASGTKVLAVNLNGDLVDPAKPVWSATYNETFAPASILDAHIVKLKGGDLLFTHLGTTWNDNLPQKPTWWNITQAFPLKGLSRPGGRAMCWMWRSSDCGKTWTQLPGLDAAMVPVPQGQPFGLYGTPRLRRTDPKKEKEVSEAECEQDPANCLKWALSGGWDGHLVYADPYSGDVFLATSCTYGNGQVNGSQNRLSFVFRSQDKGSTWTIAGTLPGRAVFRAPMASLASGTIAFAYRGSGPSSLRLATLSTPFDNVDLGNSFSIVDQPEGTKKPEATIYNIWGTRCLARISGEDPGFLVSTPYWENSSTLTLRIFRVSGSGSGPAVEVGSAIKEPSGGDILWGTLIEGPAGSNLAVLYWIERFLATQKVVAKDDPFPLNRFRVKFQAYRRGEPMLNEFGDLSVRSGTPYTWSYHTGAFPGDYMGGASYASPTRVKGASQYHFVATWTEEGCLRFNTVVITIPYEDLGLKPHYSLEETRPPRFIPPGDVKPGEHEAAALAGEK